MTWSYSYMYIHYYETLSYSRVHCNDTVLFSCTLSYSRVHCNAVIFLLACIWVPGPL